MNCFEIRNEFVSFWRRTMPVESRVPFSAHLRECPACDHAFRLFALSAPVLHSSVEPSGSPETRAQPQSSTTDEGRRAPALAKSSEVQRWSNAFAAFALAAAAGVAIYFATPPKMTFEDAIAQDYTSAESPSYYSSADSLFGQELMGRDPEVQDTMYPREPPSTRDDFAG
jgi:hypothetical protein